MYINKQGEFVNTEVIFFILLFTLVIVSLVMVIAHIIFEDLIRASISYITMVLSIIILLKFDTTNQYFNDLYWRYKEKRDKKRKRKVKNWKERIEKGYGGYDED